MEIQEMISKLDEVQKALAEMQKEKVAKPKKSEWKQTWERVLERLRNENPAIYSLLAERSVHYSPSDDYLTIWVEADSDFAFNNLRKPANVNSIVEALNAEGMANVQAGIRKQERNIRPQKSNTKNQSSRRGKERYTILKHLRVMAGLKQDDVEDLLHIQHGWLSRIERGLAKPTTATSFAHLETLAKLFDFTDNPIKLLDTYKGNDDDHSN